MKLNSKTTIASWAIAFLLGALGFSATATATSTEPVVTTQVISATSESSVSSATEIKISANITQVTYVKIPKAKVDMTACFWASGTWTNTGRRNGSIFRYRETSRAKFCPLKTPIRVGGVTYRHVKVAGGRTGSPCGNLAIPPARPQPKPQLRGKVVDLAMLTFNVTFKVTANATVKATATCPDGSASAIATASTSATANVVVKVKALTKANAMARAQLSVAQRLAVEGSATGEATASATAKATVTCGGTPPPPPPPPNPPIAETPGIAHTFVNGNATVFLKVLPANGHSVTVQASASIGNVTGIQSSATYAAESCPAGWKCYRATFWAPSTPGLATVTWKVTQNDGQKATVTSDVNVVADQF